MLASFLPWPVRRLTNAIYRPSGDNGIGIYSLILCNSDHRSGRVYREYIASSIGHRANAMRLFGPQCGVEL